MENPTPASPPNESQNRLPLFFVVVAIIAVVVAIPIVVRFIPQGGGKQGNGKVELPSPDECLRLEEQKNVAIAFLDDENFGEAASRFAELASALEGEKLGPRNLAICRLLWREMGGVTAVKDKDVREALDSLARREPESPLAHLLLARWELRHEEGLAPEAAAERLARAAAELRRAAELAPRDAAPRFELYERTRGASDPSLVSAGRAALTEAHELAPGNLWLLKELLVRQAETSDPELRKSLATAKERLAPVRELVSRRSPYDIFEFLDQCAAAEAKRDWPAALRQARNVDNIIKADDVLQADRRRLVQHLSEFVEYQFSAAFRERLAQAKRTESARINVIFRPANEDAALAKLAGAKALVTADFDLNGTPDLLVLRETELVVLGRSENANPWQVLARAEIPAGYARILVADLDDDESRDAVEKRLPGELKPPADLTLSAESASTADVDVVLYGPAGLLLLRNVRDAETGVRSLEPVELDAALGPVKNVLAAVLVDFYHDGDLDLVLSTGSGVKFWTNQGSMKFGDLTKFSVVPPPEVVFTSLVAVDWDRDADLDIVASSPGAGSLGVLENERHGQFRWVPFDTVVRAGPFRSLALLEADGNASWDLAGTAGTGVQLLTTVTDSLKVRPIGVQSFGGGAELGVFAWDYDNDGHQDLLSWNEKSVTLYRGGENGVFSQPKELLDSQPGLKGVACADFDRDGDLDLALAGQDGVALYLNDGGNRNGWLELNIRGGRDPQQKSNGRVNHNAVGSLVEVKAGASYQAQVATGQPLHFGLGIREQAEVARIVWTNGLPQAIVEPRQRSAHFEILVLKGSCPYLYTWTGEEYEFCTDLLWAAPLGLQFAEGKLAPWREWEYLKIPGERLVAKDGKYRLAITEELWEAAYFDQVELIAVDHPADVEIYSNEKVGPAEIAQQKVHTVRNPRTPVAARDKHGRDVLEEVSRRDGVYFRGFDGRLMQGLVEDNYLELDLGKLEKPKQITLFLTGWIRPTDTSLNVGVGENAALLPPRPPYILVPNAHGEWQEARAYMGFPGGKTKTIAVDLSGLFTSEDYRLRIATSAEIYWDEVFCTVDEEPATVKLTPLALVSADLHERGFSATIPSRPNAPETYDYGQVSTTPRWPPMRGKFTRFGDVRELLAATDDRHVVMGSGDEMTLEFALPLSLPLPLGEGRGEGSPGWKRDFFLHNFGWDKDADLNTVYGQTVEPLPFSAMKNYPYAVGEDYPDTPLHRQYLETYQTREQSQSRFWKDLKP